METDDQTPLPILLALVYRALIDRFHARLDELGREPLRPAHGYLFRYLAAHPEATTVEFAAHLGITKQAASKTVAELVEWGYVRRVPHPGDRRAQIVTLTGRGEEYLRFADRLWSETEQEWARVIGADRMAAVRADLRAYLDETTEGRDAPPRPVW